MKLKILSFQDRFDILLEKRPSGAAERENTMLYWKSQIILIVTVIAFLPTFSSGDGGIGDYKYDDYMKASTTHPGDMKVDDVPQFIVLDFDDNGVSGNSSDNSGGIKWFMDFVADKKNPGGDNKKTFDQEPVRATFYMTALYGMEWRYEDYPFVREAWNTLYKNKFEIGNHGTRHLMNPDLTSIDATDYSVADWRNKEIDSCHTLLTSEYDKNAADKGCGVKANDIWGWRTPRLECTNNTLKALFEVGFVYDCSLQEGRNAQGGDFVWPYTLDNGSPGNGQIGSHEGLWELPCYMFMVPSNLQSVVGGQRITGLDFYCFARSDWGGRQMSGPQFCSILKYTLDLRLQGNRSPLLIKFVELRTKCLTR